MYQDSSVSILTDYGLDDQISTLCRDSGCSFRHCVLISPEFHPPTLSQWVPRALSLAIKRPGLRMRVALHSPLCMSS
jgi:hypothetical protein